jgi:hypothetical protein
MLRTLVAAASVAAAVAVPATSAHAVTCVPVGNVASVCVNSEGIAPPPSGTGFTSASTVWVTVNGTTIALCIGRVTVSTTTVSFDPRVVYVCG